MEEVHIGTPPVFATGKDQSQQVYPIFPSARLACGRAALIPSESQGTLHFLLL